MTNMTKADYENDYYTTFVAEMSRAGRDTRHHNGRHGYSGPAVTADRDDLQAIIRETTLPLAWEELGLDLIIYPDASRQG
ncbi:MAG: hypothetical protein KJ015_41440 [Myxococcales bacterium]|nr:hypothetical protein [Myxococcales bacterium]